VMEWLTGYELPESVVFCCFGAGDAARYRARLGPGA
jgi:hypothetical protein